MEKRVENTMKCFCIKRVRHPTIFYSISVLRTEFACLTRYAHILLLGIKAFCLTSSYFINTKVRLRSLWQISLGIDYVSLSDVDRPFDN